MKAFYFTFLIMITVYASSLQQDIEEGVSYYKQKQYERALEIFDRVLINYPKSKRARLEYARVLYAMGKYDESKKEFIYVLKQNPPPIVCKNIKWFLKKIEKKRKTNFFSGFVSVGSISDSNIENKSDNPVYGGFIDSNTTKRKDRFITVEFGLNHTKKLKDALWQNSLYIYDELEHQKSSDKVSYLGFTSSYIFMVNGLRIGLPIGLSYTDVERERYMTTISFSPNISKKVSKNILLKAKLSIEKNSNKVDNEKDTKVSSLGVKWLWNIKKFSNMFGLTFKDYKRVNGTRIDVAKKRRNIDIGTSYSFLSANIVNLFYRDSLDKYKEKDPTIQTQREDKIQNFNISLQQSINKHQSFELSFSKIKNKSNLEFYSYDKNIFSIKATQRF